MLPDPDLCTSWAALPPLDANKLPTGGPSLSLDDFLAFGEGERFGAGCTLFLEVEADGEVAAEEDGAKLADAELPVGTFEARILNCIILSARSIELLPLLPLLLLLPASDDDAPFRSICGGRVEPFW